MIKTTGFSHLHLMVRSLKKSVPFYQKVFGMRVKFRTGPKMIFLSTPGSKDLLTLHQEESKKYRPGKSGGILHFGFALKDSEDLDKAVETIEKAGGKLLERGKHGGYVPYAYLADPDGYVIELG